MLVLQNVERSDEDRLQLVDRNVPAEQAGLLGGHLDDAAEELLKHEVVQSQNIEDHKAHRDVVRGGRLLQ